MIDLVQSSFQTTWASLFEMELEPNSLDWNGNELEHKHELEDMKRTHMMVDKKCWHYCMRLQFFIQTYVKLMQKLLSSK